MGFYHPATLIKEAQRDGVAVLPIDVNRSGWRCRWQCPDDPRTAPARRPGGIRIGLRYVKGLRKEAGELIEQEQARSPFQTIDDLVDRCGLRDEEASRLAEIGALGYLDARTNSAISSGLSRRQALWQVARATRQRGPLLRDLPDRAPSPLPEMTRFEETQADFSVTDITTGPHPMQYYRQELERRGVIPAGELSRLPADRRARTAGSVIVRQRPGTARGLLFLTLEDESGMCQAVVMPDELKKHRSTIVGAAGLVVEGILQKKDGSVSLKGDRFWPLDQLSRIPSHDFR